MEAGLHFRRDEEQVQRVGTGPVSRFSDLAECACFDRIRHSYGALHGGAAASAGGGVGPVPGGGEALAHVAGSGGRGLDPWVFHPAAGADAPVFSG